MKRIGFLVICILAGFGLVANGAMATVPTYTIVNGVIYESDNITPVSGASVTVECNGAWEYTASINGTSPNYLDRGFYQVAFKGGCDVGSTVTAEACKDGTCKTKQGTVNKGTDNPWVILNIAIINMSIPEFGAIAGIATMLASSIGFMLIRKRSLAQTKKKPSA